MKKEPVKDSAIRFEFVGFGERAESRPDGSNRLYLDVGGDLRPGVVDHHHLAAYSGSTASLVLAHPDLVEGAFGRPPEETNPLRITMHEAPDLDCLASAYLALAYLEHGAFPDGAEALACYVDRVDQGYVGMTQENPFSLYSAYMLVRQRLSQRVWERREDMWRRCVTECLRVVDFVLDKVAREGESILLVDAFECPGLFGPRDREEIRGDIDRYRKKLSGAEPHARHLRLCLPCHLGGTAEVDTLLARDVQGDDDPERCMFFKDWARTDRQLSSDGKGFVALSVFDAGGSSGRRRCILSVKPDAGVSLRGLGALLDDAEGEERVRLHGVDDRIEDPVSHKPKQPRPGYGSSDPWYDGRAHGYTIVDSPRSGTVLSAEKIEELFVDFGHRDASEVEPLELPAPGEFSDCAGLNRDRVSRLSLLVATQRARSASLVHERAGCNGLPDPICTHRPSPLRGRSYRRRDFERCGPNGAPGGGVPVDVFISYPRTKLGWVEANLYAPIREWRGEDRVFFDRHSLNAGAVWVDELSEAVEKCSTFVPVYCEDYFRSDFCQWELQLAITRDPTGRKRIVVPVMLETVNLPAYCSLIQALDTAGEDFGGRIVGVLNEVLT